MHSERAKRAFLTASEFSVGVRRTSPTRTLPRKGGGALVAACLAVLIAAGCASPAPGGGASDRQSAAQAGSKRIVAAITGDPHTVYQKLNPQSATRGIDALEKLVHVGLTANNDQDVRIPRLAEAVPSTENGLWRTFPDGRMETTWTLKSGPRWHDGTPVTSDDLVFTFSVVNDADLPIFGHIAFRSMEAVEAPDARTIRVKWNRPYINADALFGDPALPMPRHLLARSYAEDKASFTDLPFWSVDFVGTGPYKIREWVRGSHLVLAASDDYAMGRPKIDEIEVRFVLDANILVANVLAGAVELTLGRGISLDQAVTVRDLWKGGRVNLGPGTSGVHVWPQLLDPSPRVVSEVAFRRAMFHAIDRQELVDTIQFGLTQLFHSWLRPTEPEYARLEHYIVKYNYDPRRAVELIQGLGYGRAPDGFFRDAAGQRLELEFRTITGDVNQKALLAVADHWQRVGVEVDPVVIPTQRQPDRPYRATFPAFELLRGTSTVDGINNLHSTAARLPENNYTGTGGGTNYSRYRNPEFDALIDRFYITVSRPERMELAGRVVHHMTDQVIPITLFYDSSPAFVSNRLANITDLGGDSTLPWNVHEWELK